jgi:hypothetical protein
VTPMTDTHREGQRFEPAGQPSSADPDPDPNREPPTPPPHRESHAVPHREPHPTPHREPHPEYEVAYLRPYALTGGRTRSSAAALPIEALVEALPDWAAAAPQSTEKRRLLDLTSGQYLSVAELSAHVHLPIGVVRVLVGDLSEAGLVRIHGQGTTADPGTGDRSDSTPNDNASVLRLLESVLDGISSL